MINFNHVTDKLTREYERKLDESTRDAEARMAALHAKYQTAPSVQINPMGCICPPGANKDCESPVCPRKATSPWATLGKVV